MRSSSARLLALVLIFVCFSPAMVMAAEPEHGGTLKVAIAGLGLRLGRLLRPALAECRQRLVILDAEQSAFFFIVGHRLPTDRLAEPGRAACGRPSMRGY